MKEQRKKPPKNGEEKRGKWWREMKEEQKQELQKGGGERGKKEEEGAKNIRIGLNGLPTALVWICSRWIGRECPWLKIEGSKFKP